LSEIDVNSPRKAPLSAKPAAIRSAAVVVATGGNRLVSSALSRTAARPVIQGNRHISSSAPAFVSSNLCTKYPAFWLFLHLLAHVTLARAFVAQQPSPVYQRRLQRTWQPMRTTTQKTMKTRCFLERWGRASGVKRPGHEGLDVELCSFRLQRSVRSPRPPHLLCPPLCTHLLDTTSRSQHCNPAQSDRLQRQWRGCATKDQSTLLLSYRFVALMIGLATAPLLLSNPCRACRVGGSQVQRPQATWLMYVCIVDGCKSRTRTRELKRVNQIVLDRVQVHERLHELSPSSLLPRCSFALSRPGTVPWSTRAATIHAGEEGRHSRAARLARLRFSETR
jgi:hypothetical protein